MHIPFGNAELCCDVLAWIFCKVMWRFGQIQTAAILLFGSFSESKTRLWSQGIAWGCLQTYACTEALLLAPKPQQWSFEQMAAWSVTFATTEEAFQELAPLKHLVPETEGSDMGNHHMKPLFPLFAALLQSLSKSRGWTLRVFLVVWIDLGGPGVRFSQFGTRNQQDSQSLAPCLWVIDQKQCNWINVMVTWSNPFIQYMFVETRLCSTSTAGKATCRFVAHQRSKEGRTSAHPCSHRRCRFGRSTVRPTGGCHHLRDSWKPRKSAALAWHGGEVHHQQSWCKSHLVAYLGTGRDLLNAIEKDLVSKDATKTKVAKKTWLVSL